MKNNKIKKAEVLLDAIGEIDDSYLAQALSYKRRGRASRAAVIAAVVALISALLLSSVIGSRLSDKNYSEDMNPSNNNDGSESFVTDRLDSLILNLSDKDRFGYIDSEEELPYTGGKAYLVWQYAEDEGYYISEELSYSELESLKSQIGKGKQVGSDSPTLECRIWILLGDGSVISPYLKASAGNISSSVFDYEAEITPNDRLVNRISAILS